jgi:hypothetical protein
VENAKLGAECCSLFLSQILLLTVVYYQDYNYQTDSTEGRQALEAITFPLYPHIVHLILQIMATK